MSSRKSTLNSQILEEAAEWFVEFDREAVDLVSRQRFDEWLRRSPEHVRAFLELLPIWEQGGTPSSEAFSDDPESIIARALSARDNVVALKAGAESPARSEPTARSKTRPWLAIAASVLVCILGVWLYSQRNTYSTGVGEQHSFALADGSVIELNARSRIRVRYSEHERNIDLLEGQALFQVAHDTARPFVVHSGDARVRAVGTQFDVYRKRTGTVVTVVEGRVTVVPEQKGAGPRTVAVSDGTVPSTVQAVPAMPGETMLAAGQQTTVVSNAVEPATNANVAAATAWTQRRLVFRKASLAEVVEEFNRYNTRSMHVVDSGIQEFLVSGTFSSTDPNPLVRFLREQPGMLVVETADEIRIEAAP